MGRIHVKEVRNLVTERVMAWLTEIQPKNASNCLLSININKMHLIIITRKYVKA